MGDGKSWEDTAASFRSYLTAKIPSKWLLEESAIPSASEQPCITGTYLHQFLSYDEVSITETPPTELLSKLASGALSSYEVTSAFCHRSALAHQFLHCLLEINYAAALAEASALDEKRSSGKEPLGKLHGLPVTLKDQFVVNGLETTMGYIGWQGNKVGGKDLGESELVRILRAEGAIIICKTSVPQSLMSGETYNNIVGFAENPLNRGLTTGGSSGGEGALVALKASPLGVGTDIGGSVRIPSSYCGIYTLKPSSGRFPYKGMLNSMDGQTSMPSALGPMAPSLAMLKVFTEAVLSQQPWKNDPIVEQMPYRPFTVNRPLRIGFLIHNDFITPWPPIMRAMRTLEKALTDAGHTLVPWETSFYARSLSITSRIFNADSGHDVQSVIDLSGEPVIPQLLEFVHNPPGEQMRVGEWFALMMERRKFREDWAEYWTSKNVDVLITAATPTTAIGFGQYREHGYTSIFNNLDLPCVVLPLGKAEPGESWPEGFQPVGEKDSEIASMWDPKKFVGMPLGVQIVTRRHEEEKALATAEVVDEIIRKAGLREGNSIRHSRM